MRAVAVAGPTAGGKTALSVALAERLGGEIVVCDSMQIFRGMDIGTAKPTPEERGRVPHHLTDIVSPTEPFSASDYARLAMEAVRDITARGRLPVFCGGTGLYLDAVRTARHEGDAPPPDPALRARLQSEADTPGGKEKLYTRLSSVDPEAAAATHPNNLRRVIRALEIYETTGRTKTEIDRSAKTKNPDLDLLIFGLFYHDKSLLDARIDRRVDEMMRAGLAEETKRLFADGVFRENTTARQAIGYKELLATLEAGEDLAPAVEDIKTATRRYAKRQMTYFRAMEGLIPVYADEGGILRTPEDLADALLPTVRAFLDTPHI